MGLPIFGARFKKSTQLKTSECSSPNAIGQILIANDLFLMIEGFAHTQEVHELVEEFFRDQPKACDEIRWTYCGQGSW